MIAEVISIGDELTSGQRLDTNSQWLSERLGELGVRVMYHTTVADDLAANVAVFRAAVERADIVVATGGLGPTADDLTREVLAAVAGCELVLDEPSLEHIRGSVRPPQARHAGAQPRAGPVSRGQPDHRQSQRHRPGHLAWDMPRSSAQGVCHVFALPGVPAEMFEMFQQHGRAGHDCADSGEPRVIRHRRIKCFGAGESHVEQMLPDLIRRGRQPSVGITVHAATITLRITAAGATAEECPTAMEPTAATIRECLGALVFGEEDDELEDAVVRLLATSGKTLATVESAPPAPWPSGSAGPRATASLPGRPGGAQSRDDGRSSWVRRWTWSSSLARPRAKWPKHWPRGCRQQSGADYALAVGPFPADRDAAKPTPSFISPWPRPTR